MSSDDIYFISAVGAVLWAFGAMFGCFYLNDVKNGRIPNGEYDRMGFGKYYPAEEVSTQRWARAILWPITGILLLPLGIWLVLKFIFHYVAGIGSIYKEKT